MRLCYMFGRIQRGYIERRRASKSGTVAYQLHTDHLLRGILMYPRESPSQSERPEQTPRACNWLSSMYSSCSSLVRPISLSSICSFVMRATNVSRRLSRRHGCGLPKAPVHQRDHTPSLPSIAPRALVQCRACKGSLCNCQLHQEADQYPTDVSRGNHGGRPAVIELLEVTNRVSGAR